MILVPLRDALDARLMLSCRYARKYLQYLPLRPNTSVGRAVSKVFMAIIRFALGADFDLHTQCDIHSYTHVAKYPVPSMSMLNMDLYSW